MTEPSPQEDGDYVRTLTYSAIFSLLLFLLGAVGGIVIFILQFSSVALMCFVIAAIAARTYYGHWPKWVEIVSGHLRSVAARYLPRWML